jgi:hypothetical protein
MHGPICIFWANLTPFSLVSKLAARTAKDNVGARDGAIFSVAQQDGEVLFKVRSTYHAFGLIGTALSKKISVFQS